MKDRQERQQPAGARSGGMVIEGDFFGINFACGHRQHLKGFEMKAVFTVLIFSIVSAIGGVFAVTELRQITMRAGGSSAVIRTTIASATPQQNQELQQWVNQ